MSEYTIDGSRISVWEMHEISRVLLSYAGAIIARDGDQISHIKKVMEHKLELWEHIKVEEFGRHLKVRGRRGAEIKDDSLTEPRFRLFIEFKPEFEDSKG